MRRALILGILVLAPQAQAANPRPPTIPAVREWQGGTGAFQLRARSRIVIPRRHVARLRGEAGILAADLKELTGRRPRVVATLRKRLRPGDVRLGLGARDRRLGREGYRGDRGQDRPAASQKTWSSPLVTPSYERFVGFGERIGRAPRY